MNQAAKRLYEVVGIEPPAAEAGDQPTSAEIFTAYALLASALALMAILLLTAVGR